jgi:hypothetical protein
MNQTNTNQNDDFKKVLILLIVIFLLFVIPFIIFFGLLFILPLLLIPFSLNSIESSFDKFNSSVDSVENTVDNVNINETFDEEQTPFRLLLSDYFYYIKEGDLENASTIHTSSFSEEELKNVVTENPVLIESDRIVYTNFLIDEKTAQVNAMVFKGPNVEEFTISFVKIGEEWKIRNFRLAN